nr:MAG TPA: hypothetical protein [Caudoviricetes sp.]
MLFRIRKIIRLLCLFFFLITYQVDISNDKTTTITSKKLVNSENPRGRRPVACRITGKDPQNRE